MKDHSKITTKEFEAMYKQADEAREVWLQKAEYAQRVLYHQPHQWIPGSGDELGTQHPESVENVIKPLLRDIASLLLKNDPMCRIYPYTPVDEGGYSNFQLADEMQKHFLSAWQTSRSKYVLRKGLVESLITGLSHIEVGWDTSTVDLYGQGRINCRHVPRQDIWCDPTQSELGDGYVIHRTWHPEEDLVRMFGKDAKSAVRERKRTSYVIGEGDRRSSDWVSDSTVLPSYWHRSEDNLYPLFTLWLPGQSPGPLPFDDNSEVVANPWRWGSKSAFLRGKKLYTKPNPFVKRKFENTVGHRGMPFVSMKIFEEMDKTGRYGFYDVEGIAELLEQSQCDLNDIRRILMAIARRAMNPVIIARENAIKGATDMNLSWTSGRLILVDRNSIDMPQAVETPTVPFVSELYERTKAYMRDASGLKDWTTGLMPRGTSHTPSETVMLGQEAGFISLWALVHSIDKTILTMTDKILGLMQQLYKPGRYSAVNMNGSLVHAEWNERDISTEFRTEVVSAMTTPLRDMDKQNMATNIYGLVAAALANPGLPTLQNLKLYLRALNEPIAYEWVQLVDEMLEELRQQQQMQQQLPPPQIGTENIPTTGGAEVIPMPGRQTI